MQKARIKLTLCLTILCLLLSGCTGAKETDQLAWVIAIAIDKAGDQLEITYRIAVPRALAAGDAGGGDKKQSSILISIKAPSFAEGINLLNSTVSRQISLSQVKSIVISEELAQAGIEDLISPISRFREFRGSIFIQVARGSAKELFEKNMPSLENLPTRWIENYIINTNEASYYISSTLHEFLLRLKGLTGAPYTMYDATNPLDGKTRSRGYRFEGEAAHQYLPGDIPRTGGNPVEIAGTAVFKADKMVGALDNEETRILLLLQNRLNRTFLVIQDPLSTKDLVNVLIKNGSKPKFKVDISQEKPVIDIGIFIEGEIISIPSGIQYEKGEYLSLLEQQIANIISRETRDMLVKTQLWGTDVVDFGYYIRGKFGTRQELVSYKWDSRYPEATINVVVKTKLRRSGLMQKSTPIRRE